jgi:hypothetical protein
MAGIPMNPIEETGDFFFMTTDISQLIIQPVNTPGSRKTPTKSTSLAISDHDSDIEIAEVSPDLANPMHQAENRLIRFMRKYPRSQSSRILIFPYSVQNLHWVSLVAINSHLLFRVDASETCIESTDR